MTVLNSSPHQVLREHNPRLDQLLKRMKRMVKKSHRGEVERAVIRIVFGGLIQNAPTPQRREALLTDYRDYVCRDVSPTIREAYDDLMNTNRLLIWVTAKVVMELLDSCAENFSRDEAEFFNLFYGPVLYYHNWKKEIAVETQGRSFGETATTVRKRLPTKENMASVIERCELLLPSIFGEKKLPRERQAQLRLLLDLYETHLPPEIVGLYQRFLRT
jgi:hypothetical protein